MFQKFAQVSVLASGDKVEQVLTGLTKQAQSFYSSTDNTENKIDIQAILSEVADEYKISKNPNDYYFVAVRANSVNVPNENGDAFSKDELLRFDHHLARRIYQTYIAKPFHVNHRSDNPKMARGVILDAHYNSTNPLPEDKKLAVKKAYGVDLNSDDFVEILLAIDKTKDPHLAEGIRKGLLDSFSMGCDCEQTKCSVCEHVARTKLEFCEHIRSGKMKVFARKDGIEVKAFEWCEGVVFGEISSVDQPADPTALTEEVLELQGKVASLESGPHTIETESQILILQARLRKLEQAIEAIPGGLMSKVAQSSIPSSVPSAPVPSISVKKEEQEKDDIEEFRDKEEQRELEEGPMTGDEMGLKPMHAFKYAEAYKDLRARSEKNAVRILNHQGHTLMIVKTSSKSVTPVTILRSIAEVGLAMTAKKFKALVKNAQGGVTDYSIVGLDSKVQDEKFPSDQSILDRADSNMEEERGEEDKGTVTGEGEVTDRQEEHEIRSPVVGKKAQEAKPFEGKETPEEEALEQEHMQKESVTPPGFEDVVLKLKKDPSITNPWAVAWWMKNKGYEPKESQAIPSTPMPQSSPGGTPGIGASAASEDPEFDKYLKMWDDAGRPMEEKEGQDMGIGTDMPVVSQSSMPAAPKEPSSTQAPPEFKVKGQDLSSGSLEGADSSTEEKSKRDENTLSVLDDQDSDAREKRLEKEVTDSTQEDAERDHVEKLEARLKTLYKNKLAKAMKDFQETFAARFIRAAKLATKREALNLEPSIIKQAMGDSLMTPLFIGSDEISPVDAQATVALVERALTPKLFTSYIENLFSRAAKLMKMSDESLMQIESDIDTLQTVEPPIDQEEELEKEEKEARNRSASLKMQATRGNPVLAPSSGASEGMRPAEVKRNNIRGALGRTAVARTAQGMSEAVDRTR
jgi:hypothetical protein